MRLRNEDEIDSPNPIQYVITQPVDLDENEDITPEEVVEAMRCAKEYLELEGAEEVAFRFSFAADSSIEAYGYRLEHEDEVKQRLRHRLFQAKVFDGEYFRLKAERIEKGLPL